MLNKTKKNLYKKYKRLSIQENHVKNYNNYTLLKKIISKNAYKYFFKANLPKIKNICKINGIYGQTFKKTNLNRHFIRLTHNTKILNNWSKNSW